MPGLGSNPTIHDVRATLLEPEEYVRSVLNKMMICRREVGASVVVRIGRTGEGKAPNYRLEYFPSDVNDAKPAIHSSFRGLGHKTLAEHDTESAETTWSEEVSTFEEVQKILGELRRFQGRKGL